MLARFCIFGDVFGFTTSETFAESLAHNTPTCEGLAATGRPSMRRMPAVRRTSSSVLRPRPARKAISGSGCSSGSKGASSFSYCCAGAVGCLEFMTHLHIRSVHGRCCCRKNLFHALISPHHSLRRARFWTSEPTRQGGHYQRKRQRQQCAFVDYLA